MKRTKEFLETLFKNAKGFIELRTISSEGKVKQNWYDISEIGRLLFDLKKSYFQKVNTYFGVCPRIEEKGKEENIKVVNCFWTDLDCQNEKERKDRLDNLKTFKPSPSIIVCSGNGLHCYWLLNKPHLVKNNEDKLKVKGYLKGLGFALNGDKTFDLSRILRIPGTKNVKDPKNPLPVEILEFNPTIRYTLSVFDKFKVKVEDTAITDVDTSLNEIPDRFWRVLEENTKIRNTWEGKRKDLKDKTRSGYDMSLAMLLMPYKFNDSEFISIFRESPSGKGKEASLSYLKLTIGKAKGEYEKRKKELEQPKGDLVLLDSKIQKKKREEEEKYQEEVKQRVQKFLESVIDGQELSEKKFEPGQFWISDGLIPKKGVIVLASYKGRGKTSFALQMSLKLSKGNCKFLNRFNIKESPKKILYWYGENQPEEIEAIRKLQEKSMNLNLTKEQRKILNLVPREKLDFVRKINIDTIKDGISQLNPDIIIIDTLGWFLPGKRLNDAQTYFYLYDVLKDIKENCLWVLITHNRKPSKEDIADEPIHKIAGSGALTNNATSVIMIDRFSSKKSILYSKISFVLTRGKPVEPIKTFFNEQTRCLDVLADEIGNIMPAVASPEDIRDLIKTVGKGGIMPKDIITLAMKIYKLNDTTVYNLLRNAKNKGLITQEVIKGKTRGNKYHAL